MGKICTDLEQSRKLVELGLDPETSDAHWWPNGNGFQLIPILFKNDGGVPECVAKEVIPAWSLTALLDLMPQSIYTETGRQEFGIDKGEIDVWYQIFYENRSSYIQQRAEDAVDAAFDMIVWLLKNKMSHGIGGISVKTLDRGMALRKQEEAEEQEYAIAHLLRELGFRKESAWYIIKAKGMKPMKFKLNRNNPWHIEHRDFNGDRKFYPRMAQQWELPWGDMGTPYYQPFDHEGNIYTVPSLEQIHEFCCRHGFACYGVYEPQEIIRHLVYMYRILNNDQTAFRKYVERK